MAWCHLGDIPALCEWADLALRPAFDAADRSPVAAWIKASSWVVPIAGALHLIGLAVLGGTVFLADLRALGGGPTSVSVGSMVRRLGWLFWLGVAITVGSGLTMAAGEVMKLYYSPPFWLKAFALTAAFIFTVGARNPTYRAGSPSLLAVIFAIAALMVWLVAFVVLAETYAFAALAILAGILGIGLMVTVRLQAVPTWPCRIIACVSITMWLTVAASGRWIAFY